MNRYFCLLLVLVTLYTPFTVEAQGSYFTDITQNGLFGPCREVTVIYARGTTEPGNVGVLVGPPFFQAIAQRIGAENLAVQGVGYAADEIGLVLGGDLIGSVVMYVALCDDHSSFFFPRERIFET